MKPIDEIKTELKKWEEKNKVSELPAAESDLGHPLEVLYTPVNLAQTEYLEKIGFPGAYPFTRGIYPGMYRIRPWAMRLYSGFGTAEDTNKRWKFLLKTGNNGVACAFDLPTQMGLDSDHPEAEDEVGRVGVAIDTIRDLEILFEGLPLDQIVSSFNINAPGAIILAMYAALGQKQGIDPEKLNGTLSNDILCEYVSRGLWVFPVQPALRLTTDVVEYCTKSMPRFYPFNIRGIIMREAGASMVQEAGFAFANAIAYIDDAVNRGLDIDAFAPRISFFFATGTQIFEEAARYRAARRVWARVMKERFGAQKPSSMLFKFTGTVGGSYYRAQEPENNLIRGAYGVLANVLGGTQGMLHPAMDEPFAIPTEETAKLALRTQQICAYETGVAKVADPLGGSYYIEALTDQLVDEIEKVIKTIDGMGGAVAAIEKGYMQQRIADEAHRMAMDEKAGKRVVVGVNKFVDKSGKKRKMSFHKFNYQMLTRQKKRLAKIRKERDNDAVRKALARLADEAKGRNNLVPPLIETVKTYASIGEIMGALKEVFGTFREPLNI
ncbi:MAG: methylmalonyl-CoA mutase family protein [bacterium]|nr:methylmalonyl-CoA mutase family protein [bacterium]